MRNRPTSGMKAGFGRLQVAIWSSKAGREQYEKFSQRGIPTVLSIFSLFFFSRHFFPILFSCLLEGKALKPFYMELAISTL